MPGKKLLVADDSLTIQKVIKLALSNEGYEIQTVSEGNDALQQIALFRPEVVLVDVSLPEKTAFEIKKELNQSPDLAHTRFILMSSAYEKYDETQYRALGFSGKLTKPFDPAHLRKLILDTLPSQPEIAAPVTSQASSHEDIKILTRSTLEMSESGDFSMNPSASSIPEDLQWTVNETAKLPPPLETLPENPAAALSFSNTSSTIPDFSPLHTLPTEPSLPLYPQAGDLSGSNFEFDSFPKFDDTLMLEPQKESPPSEFDRYSSHSSGSADVSPLSKTQMENLMKQQLQETLEKMAREMLPDLAEKIIRAEIHRMLNDKNQ